MVFHALLRAGSRTPREHHRGNVELLSPSAVLVANTPNNQAMKRTLKGARSTSTVLFSLNLLWLGDLGDRSSTPFVADPLDDAASLRAAAKREINGEQDHGTLPLQRRDI